MKRLAIARFWFGANAFSQEATTLESFQCMQWLEGEQALASAQGGDSELGAVRAFTATRPEWTASVLRCAEALPAGPVDDSAFEHILGEITGALAGGGWDAVYLCLHGAAITGTRLSPDVELIKAVRSVIGDTPLAASFSMRANIHPDIAGLLDFCTGVRTDAASDLHETAMRALLQLEHAAATGAGLQCAVVSTGMVLTSFNMRTGDEPMAGLLRMARDAERDGVRDVSLFGGFPYADSPHCAAKVVAWADSEPAARQAAAALADAWRAQKQAFRSVLPGPNMALAQALKAPAGLVAVTDVADNPGSGGGADSTTLFRALLDLKLSEPAVFAYFFDASLVEQARAVGTGGAFDAEIGARNSRDFGARVQAPARVLRLTDGVFRNRGPLGFGAAVGIGASALLDVAGVKTIVTSQRVRADDPAFFELHGIDLAATRLLCVKAKNRFRAAFRPLCVRIIDCDAPGPATADLRALPFQNVKMR